MLTCDNLFCAQKLRKGVYATGKGYVERSRPPVFSGGARAKSRTAAARPAAMRRRAEDAEGRLCHGDAAI